MADATNPVMTGLLGGVGVLALQFIWKRTMGTDQKSIPVQLSEINTKLAEIYSMLGEIKLRAEFRAKEFEELKADFWRHMEKYHNAPAPTPRKPGDSTF